MNHRALAPDRAIRLLLHAAGLAQAALEARLNSCGLTPAKYAALRALEEAGGALPLSDLAGRLACVKSNITQLVDRLEADGLVARKQETRDRRTRLAALTAAGRKICREGLRMERDAAAVALVNLSPEEARRLGALLGKIAKQGE